MPSAKKQISCRISNETYGKLLKLVEGDNSPFESVSEYLYTLILKDLSERERGAKSIEDKVKDALMSPEVLEYLKKNLPGN